MKTKTEQAIELVEAGMNRYQAAKQVGVGPSAVYAALKRKRLRDSGVCPECGQGLGSGGSVASWEPELDAIAEQEGKTRAALLAEIVQAYLIRRRMGR